MALHISQHEVDGVTVVALEGAIGLGGDANSLREKIKELLAEGKRRVVLDVGKVTMVDSAGLGTLVGIHQSTSSRGASLRLCNLGGKLRELLQMTRLLTVFTVAENEAEAVRSFPKSA